MQADGQAAEFLDGQRVVAGLVHPRVDPRPRAGADEFQGILIGGAGDADVDGGMQDLGEGSDRGRALEGGLEGHQVLGPHRHVVEDHRTAAGGALAEAGPVVDHAQPRGVARYEGQVLVAVLGHHQGGHAVGVEGAGAVELAAIDAVAGAFLDQPGVAVVGGARADLGQGIAETLAGQGGGEQAAPLHLAAVHPQHFEGIEDLQLLVGQAPLAVALGGTGVELGGDAPGHVEGLGIVADDGDVGRRSVLQQGHDELLRSRNGVPAGCR
ncbi:hypothetical protein D3C85_1224080 [compost metagenome]